MLEELLRCTKFETAVDPGLIREPAPEDRSSNHSSRDASPSISTSAAASSRHARSGKARRERGREREGEREETPGGKDEEEEGEGEQESTEARTKKPSAIEYWLRMNAARELLSDALGKLVTTRQGETTIRERARRLGITPAEEQSALINPAQANNTNIKEPDTNANANQPQNPKPKPFRFTEAHVKFLQKVRLLPVVTSL